MLHNEARKLLIEAWNKTHDLEWGGEWQETPDKPHYQMTFNYSCSELLKQYKNNEVDDNGYVIL